MHLLIAVLLVLSSSCHLCAMQKSNSKSPSVCSSDSGWIEVRNGALTPSVHSQHADEVKQPHFTLHIKDRFFTSSRRASPALGSNYSAENSPKLSVSTSAHQSHTPPTKQPDEYTCSPITLPTPAARRLSKSSSAPRIHQSTLQVPQLPTPQETPTPPAQIPTCCLGHDEPTTTNSLQIIFTSHEAHDSLSNTQNLTTVATLATLSSSYSVPFINPPAPTEKSTIQQLLDEGFSTPQPTQLQESETKKMDTQKIIKPPHSDDAKSSSKNCCVIL